MTVCAKSTSSASPIKVLLASVLVQLCLGGVYAWSTFVPPLQEEHGFSSAQTQIIFGTAIAAFTLAMIPAGRSLSRYGPRRLIQISGILFSLGYFLAAASGGSFILMLLGIGVIGGAGIGCGYVCPMITALSWYPHKRGLAIGYVVAGFGAGAIVLVNATALAFNRGIGVLPWFACLGLGYGILLLLCSRWMVLPEKASGVHPVLGTCAEFWKDRKFWALAWGMFCGTFAGLLVIGNLKSIGLDWGVASGAATAAVSLFAVGNAAGRIGWGWLADRFGSRQTIPLLLAIGVVSLAIWQPASGAGAAAFLAVTILIAFVFGGCFVLFAAQVSRIYGPEHLPTIYPFVFLSYGLAALTGPTIGGWLYDSQQDYALAAFIAAAVCGAGAGGFHLLMRNRPEPIQLQAQREVA